MNWYRNSTIFLPFFNHLIRLILHLKCTKDKHYINKKWKGKENEIEKWYKDRDIFFGFSSIRSGTVFIANILATETKNAHIEHEANIDDYWHYPKAIGNDEEASNYINNYRLKEIPTRANRKCTYYGEVNPFLRLHCKAIKTALPKAKLFHIVRDGRQVVRSIMSREILGRKDPFKNLISPPSNDPYARRWSKMERFERVCWQWQYENHFIRNHVPHFIRFEDLLVDYDYFKANLLDYLDIHISMVTWKRYVDRPINITPNYQMGPWETWSDNDQKIYEEYCSKEMQQYGYSI